MPQRANALMTQNAHILILNGLTFLLTFLSLRQQRNHYLAYYPAHHPVCLAAHCLAYQHTPYQVYHQ